MDHYLVYFFVFITTIISIWFLTPIAIRVGLVDRPNYRKKHGNDTPLIGGIAILFGVMVGVFLLQLDLLLLLPFVIVTIMGSIDDLIGISFKLRFAIQIIAIVILFNYFANPLNNLGDILGLGDITLAKLSMVVTIFASIGVMNSFNFSDGIDGLAGSLAMITLSSVIVLSYLKDIKFFIPFLVVVILAIVPYLFFNLRYRSNQINKIFMGDAGSMLIGLILAYCLIHFSQGNNIVFSPVTALWIYALPLIDTVAIMLRRVINKKSPFKPDRKHLHHFFQRIGFSDRKTLFVLTLISITFAVIGVLSDLLHIAEWKMFVLFLIIFLVYFFAIMHAWKLAIFFNN